jgi:hypothetical protein
MKTAISKENKEKQERISALWEQIDRLRLQRAESNKWNKRNEVLVYFLMSLLILMIANTINNPNRKLGFSLHFDDMLTVPVVLLATMPLLISIVFHLVFGLFPIQFLRLKYSVRGKNITASINSLRREIDKILGTDEQRAEIIFYEKLVEKSERLSKAVYNRASVYLFIGSIIALGGLLYFTYYFQSISTDKINLANKGVKVISEQLKEDNILSLIHLAPRFGALLFLEFIAFFFLKQYKFTMDEFRYYEGIQRLREEKLFFINMLNTQDHQKDLIDILKSMTSPDKIIPGESSLLIESKKVHSDDFEILNKIIDKVNIGK